MLVLSIDHSLDELQDLAEEHGFSRNVVKPISMIVYDIPDEAFHGVKEQPQQAKRRGRASKKHSESDQGVTDGDQE